MNFEDCIKFANENPVCYIATVDENGQPRVRGFLMWRADKTGFYFNTGTTKDFYRQLQANPKIEICFFNQKNEGGVMMRVTGEAEYVDDMALRKRLVEEREFLKAWGYTADDPKLVLFRLAKGEACFWTMETNFEPKKTLKF